MVIDLSMFFCHMSFQLVWPRIAYFSKCTGIFDSIMDWINVAFLFGISFKGLLTLFANGVLFVFMLYFYIFRKIACSENAKITNTANGFFGIFMMASIKMDLEGSFILKAITAVTGYCRPRGHFARLLKDGGSFRKAIICLGVILHSYYRPRGHFVKWIKQSQAILGQGVILQGY